MKYVEYQKILPDELEDRLYSALESDESERRDFFNEGEE